MTLSTIFLKTFKLSALATALTLAGCGGGGGNDTVQPPADGGVSNGGTNNGGTVTTPIPTTLLLTSEFDQMKLAVGNKLKVTALALDKDSAVLANVPVSFKLPTGTGISNNSGAVVTTDATGQAVIEIEIKDLAAATTALQSSAGVVITAQSGSVSATTTIRGATSNSNTEAYKFFVTQSKNQMNTASDTVSMSVRVTDIQGGVKAGVPVYLQTLDDANDFGLSFSTPSNLTTDANGLVNFDVIQSDIGLKAQLDHNVKFKIIVNDGVYKALEQTIELPVTGTHLENVTLDRTQLTINDTFNIKKATLVDGNGKGIANTTVELVNSGSTTSIGVTPVKTDAQGNFTFNNIPASLFNVNADGTVNLAVKVGTADVTQLIDAIASLTIISNSNNSIVYQGDGSNLLIRKVIPVTIKAPDAVSGTISVSTTRGVISATNSIGSNSRIVLPVQNGQATVYLYSQSPGESKLTVQTNNTSGQTVTLVDDTANFVSISPTKLALQLEKTIVPTNGSTRIIAKVLDANDAPVKNAIVSFNITNDPSSGTLSNASAVTDASGQAIVSYSAGSVPSPVNGVSIQAKVNSLNVYNVQGQAVETSLPTPLTALQTLTVQTFSSSIGVSFADVVEKDPLNVYYYRNGSIYIVNSVGQPAANLPVSISIIPTQYNKGFWGITYEYLSNLIGSSSSSGWHLYKNIDGTDAYIAPSTVTRYVSQPPYSPTAPLNPLPPSDPNYLTTPNSNSNNPNRAYYEYQVHSGVHSCTNEDINRNNFLDAGEDVNSNGQLDPINPATVLDASGNTLTANQTLMTDSTGKLNFKVRYPKEYSNWFIANVQVSTKVDGTESIQVRSLDFPVAVSDVDINVPVRPNWYSPFGTYSCASSQ